MLKIAFDVKGTLVDGHSSENIRKLLILCRERGHEITVWSNLFTYTVDFLKDYPTHARFVHDNQSKDSKGDRLSHGLPLFDFAFEDDIRQTYLGAKNLIFVQDVPEGNLENFLDSIGIKDIKV